MSKEATEVEGRARDRVVRAMTQDGQFRVMAATMSDTVAEAQTHQHAPQELLARQAQLMCAGVLIRETMQPGNRVQVIIKDHFGHRLVTDSLPDGRSRSIINPGEDSARVGHEGLFQVNYTLRNGELHQGIVAIEHGSDVSAAMMLYLKNSEQITAYVWIESFERDNGEVAVGGFVMQVTPEVTPEGLEAMTAHLESYNGLPQWLDDERPEPKALIADILAQHEYAILADSELFFGCTCSVERMLLSLSTLDTAELGEMLSEGKPVEADCDACGRHYEISTDEVAELLKERDARQRDQDTPPN